jgi:hypothetical protein
MRHRRQQRLVRRFARRAAVSCTASRPAGYEMRWWAPNRDDIVADVFLQP